MKELANLSRIVTSRCLQTFPLLDLAEGHDTKEALLVAKLVDRPDITKNQLIREIYGRTSPASTDAFRKLHSRVQAKLLNHLYFLDHSDERHMVARRHEQELLELFHQLNALHAEGEYVLAERLLRKCLRLALAGEFTQYAVLAARLLRNLYANQRQATRYKQIAKQLVVLQELLAWEDESERMFAETRLAMLGTVAARRGLLPKVSEYINQAAALHRRASSFSTYYYLYRLRIVREELLGNYAEIIRITTEADRRWQQGKLNIRRFDKRFNQFMSLYAHLRGRQPVRGLKLAEVYAQDFHPSSNNWFYFQEHHLMLALHAGMFDKAHQVLASVMKNPFYPKQREAAQQRWELFRAYIDFLLPPSGPVKMRQMAQWALSLPDFSRDKRGHNVAILILQVLYYLRLRDLDAVLVRMERLRKYQQRHLRDINALRSRLFLRLLLLLADKNFDPVVGAERGQSILKKLQATPPPGEADAEIEVIPYEKLWELTLNLLREGPLVTA